MRLITRTPLAALGILVAMALAACGGSSSSTSSPTTAAAIAAAATATPSYPGGPSTSFQLLGQVNTPKVYDLAALKALPQASVETNPQSGSGSLGDHTYAGPLVYDLLQAAGVKSDPNIKNDTLRKSIVITGSNGYQTALAWGEIDPKFANKKVIIAVQTDGQDLASKDGFARLIVPGDAFAGRYISNVVKIEVKDAAPAGASATRAPTTSFQLTGLVNSEGAIDLAKLQSMPQTTVTIDSGGTKTVYGGVLLSDLLTSAGLKLDWSKKNDNLTKGIVGVGSDGYTSLVVGGEIDPKFGGVQVLVAISKDGQPLTDADGFARIVVPGDIAAGRYVSNLKSIQVVQL